MGLTRNKNYVNCKTTIMSNHKTESGGISGLFALFLIFLVLKLIGTISWSWWWVTCPLWGPAAIILLIFMIFMIVNMGTTIPQPRKEKSEWQKRIEEMKQKQKEGEK